MSGQKQAGAAQQVSTQEANHGIWFCLSGGRTGSSLQLSDRKTQKTLFISAEMLATPAGSQSRALAAPAPRPKIGDP
ncbi:hypothetical protein GT002_02800 [Streptomyces sp. SID4917]|nr:hypothetical protein [Streptomyces sp. SID4917]